MTPATSTIYADSISLTDSFERYLQDKGKGRGGDGGNYRRNTARELERFGQWATGDRGRSEWTGIIPEDVDRDPTFQDLDERVFRAYARYLDNSEKMIRKRYSHIEADELGELATEAINEIDCI